MSLELLSLDEEGWSWRHISLVTQHRAHQTVILVNGTIQVAPCSLHSHVGFIYVPDVVYFSFALDSELLGK